MGRTSRPSGGWRLIGGTAAALVLSFAVLPALGLKSLWLDEADAANRILLHDFSPRSLKHEPLGFALLVATVVDLARPTEAWFRAVPFLFALSTIPLIYVLAVRLGLERWDATFASLLLALNPGVITYAKTMKHYSADMFAAALVAVAAAKLRSASTTRRWIVYSIGATLAILVSYPAIAAVAVASMLLLMRCLRVGTRSLLTWMAVHVLPTGLLAWYATSFLLSQARQPGLLSYWDSGFPPSLGVGPLIGWYADQAFALIRYLFLPVGSTIGPATALTVPPFLLSLLSLLAIPTLLVILLATLGVAGFGKGRMPSLLLLLGPLCLAAVAAVFRLYPLDGRSGGRLFLLSLPGLVILLVAGLRKVREVVRWRLVWLAALTVSLLPAIQSIYLITHPLANIPGTATEETRDLVTRTLLPSLRSEDLVYVYYGASHAFRFYTPELRGAELSRNPLEIRGGLVFFGSSYRDDPTQYDAEILRFVNAYESSRLWLVFSHIIPEEETLSLETLSGEWNVDLERDPKAARLYLAQHRPPKEA